MEEDVLPKVHQNLVHALTSESTQKSSNKNNWPINVQKRNPPPIPKRNPDTRLSAGILTRPAASPSSATLGRRSLQSDRPLLGPNALLATNSAAGDYYEENDNSATNGDRAGSPAISGPPHTYAHPVLRQYSTLPGRRRNRAQKLDVCAELLSYISELTQELMAETSFTEPAFDDAGSSVDVTSGGGSGAAPANWSQQQQSQYPHRVYTASGGHHAVQQCTTAFNRGPGKSVAIQTEDPQPAETPPTSSSSCVTSSDSCYVTSDPNRSIGIQATKWSTTKSPTISAAISPSRSDKSATAAVTPRRGDHSPRYKPSACVLPQPEITSPESEMGEKEVKATSPLPLPVRPVPEVVLVDSPVSSVASPTKPFNVIRKMLREGSIEGIEDEPPVFKPPPPPASTQVAYVTGRPHQQQPSSSPDEAAMTPEHWDPVHCSDEQQWPNGSPSTNCKVKKCLSTFEPPELSEPIRNGGGGSTTLTMTSSSKKPTGHAKGPSGHHHHHHRHHNNTKKVTQKSLSTKLMTMLPTSSSNTSISKSIIQPTISIVQRKATLAEHMTSAAQPEVFVNGNGSSNGKRKISVSAAVRSPSFTSKAATLDRCFHQKMTSPVDGRQQQQGLANAQLAAMTSRTPPPPPLGKEPPPKILVEMPTKKHRQSSSACGTTCSCLCLKRQSPCSSPVLSLGSLPSSPPPAAPKRYSGYSPTSKDKSPDISQFTTDVSCVRQDAYDALIAEIRAAIKQRQATPPGHDEQAL